MRPPSWSPHQSIGNKILGERTHEVSLAAGFAAFFRLFILRVSMGKGEPWREGVIRENKTWAHEAPPWRHLKRARLEEWGILCLELARGWAVLERLRRLEDGRSRLIPASAKQGEEGDSFCIDKKKRKASKSLVSNLPLEVLDFSLLWKT